MKLPADLFEAIIGCVSLQLDSGRGSERRRQGRVRLPARVHIIPMSQNMAGNPLNVQVRDISRDGIGLLLPRKLMIGDSLLARLVTRTQTFWMLCEVKRAERVAEGLYVTGATYNRVVDISGDGSDKLTVAGQSA